MIELRSSGDGGIGFDHDLFCLVQRAILPLVKQLASLEDEFQNLRFAIDRCGVASGRLPRGGEDLPVEPLSERASPERRRAASLEVAAVPPAPTNSPPQPSQREIDGGSVHLPHMVAEAPTSSPNSAPLCTQSRVNGVELAEKGRSSAVLTPRAPTPRAPVRGGFSSAPQVHQQRVQPWAYTDVAPSLPAPQSSPGQHQRAAIYTGVQPRQAATPVFPSRASVAGGSALIPVGAGLQHYLAGDPYLTGTPLRSQRAHTQLTKIIQCSAAPVSSISSSANLVEMLKPTEICRPLDPDRLRDRSPTLAKAPCDSPPTLSSNLVWPAQALVAGAFTSMAPHEEQPSDEAQGRTSNVDGVDANVEQADMPQTEIAFGMPIMERCSMVRRPSKLDGEKENSAATNN